MKTVYQEGQTFRVEHVHSPSSYSQSLRLLCGVHVIGEWTASRAFAPEALADLLREALHAVETSFELPTWPMLPRLLARMQHGQPHKRGRVEP